jgi:hypothetical protein
MVALSTMFKALTEPYYFLCLHKECFLRQDKIHRRKVLGGTIPPRMQRWVSIFFFPLFFLILK